MARDLDRIFGRLGQQGGGEGVAWMPKIDVKRSGDDVMVRAELPGVKPEDVDVELSDNVLTISGERKQEQQTEDEGYLIRESSYGSFERSLTVPESVDPSQITANFNDGVLEVRVPKAFEESQPRRTKISVGGQTRMQISSGQGQMGQQGSQQMQQQMSERQGQQMSEQGMTEEQTQRERQTTGMPGGQGGQR
jgi:HSP20 family protein